MVEVTGVVLLIVALIDGLLFGLAIKKGVTSFILIIIALIISTYVGFSFAPHVSLTNVTAKLVPYIKTYADQITKAISIGFGGSLSLTIVLFLIGLGVGLWKG
ncbi:TVG0374366 [Thermoplasma volcanium GSS1]|uniref:TVG0374366 protein n=1 Tax=Thermoplasma volcanium (strain ATCC 51530 / DSM 4299 / JCM 9571 / NBRC 15438 / GSS1) TaxID=273116 RepID=Q97BR7_THEVO|nr:hypothetical protein [Thermoplasma volcanium]BAB59530.1 TVG0374366 [Thermoplasma volcanium GSS1]